MDIQALSISEEASSAYVQVRLADTQTRLHYNDFGDKRAEPVVMLHGSGPGASSWANFYRNIEPLLALNYRVILLDFPGWAKSDPVVSRSSRSHLNAAALGALLDALNIDKAHLVGNSMGGHSAVAYALDNPRRVGKLVLMGGGTGGSSPFFPMPTEGLKLINALYREPTIDRLKQMMNVFVYDPSTLTEELFQKPLANILEHEEHCRNFVESMRVNPKQYPDVGYRLAEIDAPTLLVWGRDDRFVPLDVGLRLLAGIRHSQLHVFSQCGHWAQWEHADRFNRLLGDFLQEGR